MKIKDYLYLSSLDIRRNPGRSIKTIFILALGLTFSIITVFTVFAFYFGTLHKLDNNLDFNSIKIQYYTDVQYTTSLDGSIKERNPELYIKADKDSFENYNGILYSPIYYYDQIYSIKADATQNLDKVASIKIGNSSQPFYSDVLYHTNYISIVSKLDVAFINRYYEQTINKSFLLAGREIKNSNELLVSSDLLSELNVTIDDVLNKEITITEPTPIYINVVNNSDENIYVLNRINNMKIVGIYNPMRYYENKVVKTKYFFNSGIILLSDSVYTPNTKEIDNKKYNIIDENFKEGMMMNLNNSPKDIIEKVLFFEDYASSSIFYDYALKNFSLTQMDYVTINDNYSSYTDFHNSITNITVFIGCLSIILIIIAIFNIYDIVSYNALKKKKNIGMMKAIGLKDKDAFKLFYCEFSLYMIISGLISITFSFSISGMFTISANSKLDFSSLGFDIGASVNFWFYFLALLIVYGVIFITSYLYILCVTKSLVKKKPVDLLR